MSSSLRKKVDHGNPTHHSVLFRWRNSLESPWQEVFGSDPHSAAEALEAAREASLRKREMRVVKSWRDWKLLYEKARADLETPRPRERYHGVAYTDGMLFAVWIFRPNLRSVRAPVPVTPRKSRKDPPP